MDKTTDTTLRAACTPASAGSAPRIVCRVYGPCDYLLCDRMLAEIDTDTVDGFKRNPDFGVGYSQVPAIRLIVSGNRRLALPFCPFCGGSLRLPNTAVTGSDTRP